MALTSQEIWSDLSGYSATTDLVGSEVMKWTVRHQSEEKMSVLLLPRGLFSLYWDAFWPTMGIHASPEDLLALGRIVARHTRSAPERQLELTAELNQLEQDGLAAARLAWPHLPGVTGIVARGPGRIAVTALRCDASTLGLFTSVNTIRPISWLHLPADPVGPQLLMGAAQAILDGVPAIEWPARECREDKN